MILGAFEVGFEPVLFVILFVVAVIAGWVDSIGGGGGLICIPALLWAGFAPLQALATNKLQASFGSSTAAYRYSRHGLVDVKGQKLAIALTFLGAVCGALTVQQIGSDLLAKAIPLLLMLFALYFLFSPKISDGDQPPQISSTAFALTVGFGVGFYDGFFGPGAGAFFTMGYVALLGFGLPKATGNTKLLNFTSNFSALLFFALSGQIVWLLGLVMGVGQMIGSYMGTRMAVKHGTRLIRPVLVTVSLLLSLKLLFA
jgi:hypothetical protein